MKKSDILKLAQKRFEQPELPKLSVKDIVSANQAKYMKEGSQVVSQKDVRRFVTPRLKDKEGDFGFAGLVDQLLP